MITVLMLVIAAAGYMLAPHLPGRRRAGLKCLRTAGVRRVNAIYPASLLACCAPERACVESPPKSNPL